MGEKKLWKSLFYIVTIGFLCPYVSGEHVVDNFDDKDFYSFEALDINNKVISLDKYKGKVSLVVNVASECGYTDNHYNGLNLLQKSFEDTQLFNVLAFPCNQFGQQEPGTSEQIYDFVYKKRGAKFPLFAKVNVVNQNVHPAWIYLTNVSQAPNWNFWKYLVDHNGHVINAWGPRVPPEDLYDAIKTAIENVPSISQDTKQFNRLDEF